MHYSGPTWEDVDGGKVTRYAFGLAHAQYQRDSILPSAVTRRELLVSNELDRPGAHELRQLR